jgi:hypothetical protein
MHRPKGQGGYEHAMMDMSNWILGTQLSIAKKSAGLMMGWCRQ